MTLRLVRGITQAYFPTTQDTVPKVAREVRTLSFHSISTPIHHPSNIPRILHACGSGFPASLLSCPSSRVVRYDISSLSELLSLLPSHFFAPSAFMGTDDVVDPKSVDLDWVDRLSTRVDTTLSLDIVDLNPIDVGADQL